MPRSRRASLDFTHGKIIRGLLDVEFKVEGEKDFFKEETKRKRDLCWVSYEWSNFEMPSLQEEWKGGAERKILEEDRFGYGMIGRLERKQLT